MMVAVESAWSRPSRARASTAAWVSNRTFLGTWHLAKAIISFSIILKSDSQVNLVGAVAAVNALAWFCCTRLSLRQPATHESNRRMQLVCFVLNMVSWGLRTVTHYRWGLGVELTPVMVKACSSKWMYLSEAFVCTVEQVYALMFLPSAVVVILLAIHLRTVYSIAEKVQGEQSLVVTCIWVVTELVLPHLVHLYMQTTVQREQNAGAADVQRTSVIGAPRTSQGSEAPEGKGTDKAGTYASASDKLCSTVAAPDAEVLQAGAGLSRECTPGEAAAPATAVGHLPSAHLVPPSQVQQVPAAHAVPPPPPAALRSLQNARALMQKQRVYRSRFVQPQVVIKLEDAEPQQLRSDVLTAVTTAMNQGRASAVISRACVRMGCVLLQFDLMHAPNAHITPGDPDYGGLPFKAWLDSLLSPGTPIPDGAVAHITLGSRHLRATWDQEQGSWVVVEAVEDLPPATAPLNLSVLFVGNPVAQLPLVAASNSSNIHRVSLLLEVPQPAASVVFVGSDQVSAPPEQPAGSRQVSVQCVARGCWGTCLPVAVAEVEVESEGEADKDTTLIALTLDVDLSGVETPGAVQLELWCGRTSLASAAVVLIPPDGATSTHTQANSTDGLLEELQGHVRVTGGTSALLTDLGQVLYSVECVRGAADAAGHAQAGSLKNGPSSSWGGIVAGLAAQHVSDAATLSSMHELASGLLEYAKSEGLKHAAALLVSGIMTLHQRLEELRSNTAGVAATGPSHTTKCSQSNQLLAGVKATAEAPEGSSVSSALGAKEGLRQRKPEQKEPDPSSGGRKATDVAGQHQPPATRAAGRQPYFNGALVLGCIRHALHGFQHGAEEQYKLWVAERYNTFLRTHGMLLSLWTVASFLRSALDGWDAIWAVLPVNLVVGVPWVTSALVAMYKQHRWQEAMMILHGIGRTACVCTTAFGILTRPANFAQLCKYRMHLWTEGFVYPLAEPMRLPALLVSHFILFGFDLSTQRICNCEGPACVLQALALRLFAFAVGLSGDVFRRYAFLREQ